jgi:hypothetical protein
MTKVLFHGSIKGFRGRIGDLIFRQMPDGTTVVTQAPPKKTRREKKRAQRKRSERQRSHNEHFHEAVGYARHAHKINPLYAEKASMQPMVNSYNLALSDAMKPPEIHCIEKKAGHIRVKVTDNFLVSEVRVSILDGEGKVLEKGEAVKCRGDWWSYTPQVEGKAIRAEAWDLPGQKTKLIV